MLVVFAISESFYLSRTASEIPFPFIFEFFEGMMEFERTNISFFILFVLVKSFFKLSVFLKTVSLGHGALFFVRFQYIPFTTEFLEFPIENLIFAEFTFQRTVVYRYFN